MPAEKFRGRGIISDFILILFLIKHYMYNFFYEIELYCITLYVSKRYIFFNRQSYTRDLYFKPLVATVQIIFRRTAHVLTGKRLFPINFYMFYKLY